MAKRLGATVITTVSTEAKAALASQAGADHVVIYTKQDFEEASDQLVQIILKGCGLQATPR